MNNNKSTIPEKRNIKLSTESSSFPEDYPTTIPLKINTPIFNGNDIFYNRTTKEIIRMNNIGVIEKLDYDSYIEAINTEKQLNEELNLFLNNISSIKRNK